MLDAAGGWHVLWSALAVVQEETVELTSSRKLVSMSLVALALAILGACGSSNKRKGSGDLKITAHAPGEARIDEHEPIHIQFAEPVADEKQVGVLLDKPPVSIEPEVAFTAQWADRQTLVVTPSQPLVASTRYVVELEGELAERTGGFEFAFINMPLEVDGIWGVDVAQLPPSPTLPIHFNQPVSAKAVIDHCRIDEQGGNSAIRLATADEKAVAEVVEVTVRTTLDQGKSYILVCDGLSGASGSATMPEAFQQNLETYPVLSVTSIIPDGQDVPADDVEIRIELSTPVTLEVLRKHLVAEPPIPALSQGALTSDGKSYAAVVNLEVQTDYTITLGKGLTDIFEQTLDTPYSYSFHTGNARPRLSLETGIYAVEPVAEGYPVWTRSVGKFDVECAAVPKNKIVDVLTSEMDYDPWYNASNRDEIDWKGLGLRARQKQVTIAEAKNNWHLERIVMHETCGGSQRGMFLADFSSEEIEPDPNRTWAYRPNKRVLANVTDLGILLKAGAASGLVWVTSLSTGEPVAGAQVELYSPKSKRKVWSGVTDRDGLVRTPGSTALLGKDDDPEQEWSYYSYRSQRLVALVSKGDDLAAVDGNWANGIQIWNFGVSEDRSSGTTRIRGLIQSDRGVYRPGETVNFKGLVREIAIGQAARVPGQRRVQVTISDSRGSTVFDKPVQVTRFGGFSFDLPLSTEAPTGDYAVVAKLGDQTFREQFQVEEFRKVTFEVGVTSPERHTQLGAKLAMQVQADFLFGAPVVDAAVEWDVQRRDHTLHFPQFPGYSFTDHASKGYDWWYDPYYESSYTSFVSDGQGKTDALGAFTFSVRDSSTSLDGPQDYIVRARVTDESDQTVGKQAVITAHPSKFYLGMHTQEWVQAVDMPFAVNTIAIAPDGTQRAARASLSFIRQSYDCSYSSGGYRAYQTCTRNHKEVFKREIDIPATGNGTESITPKQPGEYIIRLEGVDENGAQITASSTVWVIGKGEAFWSGDEDARMSLVASKSQYKPGETAKVVARTGIKSPTTLITLERNGIIDAKVVELDSASQGIEIPLDHSHAPNVFASIAMVSGRTGKGDRNRPQFKMGVVDLPVSSDAHELDVAITTDKDSYQPGQTVTGSIKLTSAGEPVVGEVALSVADEGVLQLIDYKTPDPMRAFFASWGLGVDAGTNWNRISRLNDPMGESDEEEGGDSGSSSPDRVRSKFVSSAYWAPHLVTSRDGTVEFSFTAPDNLTAFRLMAVAADDGTRFGSSEKRITIAKPLLAKPIAPRFLGEGDVVEVGVVVHNYTGAAGSASVVADARGFALHKQRASVELADGASARVRFRGKVKERAAASLEFAVTMGSHKDALTFDVPIERGLIYDKQTLARGAVGGDSAPSSVEVPVAWKSGILAGESELTITIDRTGLAELEPSLAYLVEYPYGCLEQTLSRFVPLAKAKDLAETLDIQSLDKSKMDGFLRAGVAKVIRHQHGDGHFSLWPSGKSYPHLTVYALWGLLEAERAGLKVDKRAVSDGLTAMKRWASDKNRTLGANYDTGTVAMAAYVLAEHGQADAGLNARLFEARRGMPRYAQAYTLMAMARAKADKSQIDSLLTEIVESLEATGDTAVVVESIDQRQVMGSDVRSTAIALSALLEVAPNHPAVDKLAQGLKSKQLPSGRWRNTQDNMYGLVALAAYARDRGKGSARVVVKAGDKELGKATLRGGKALVLRKPLSKMQQGPITIESQGRALFAVRLTEARQDRPSSAHDAGFSITREYFDAKSGQPVTSPAANQLIRVKLTIQTAKERHFVAIRDRLPAGLEPVNSRLTTEAGSAATNHDDRDYWSPRKWTHIDLRDEGAQVFADYLDQGEHVYEYNARATMPGTFALLPAEVEAMYEPDIRGRTAAGQMKVR